MISAEHNETKPSDKRIRSFHPKKNPSKPRQKDKPESLDPATPVFHAHALDLDPNIVIPERPSVDLNYTDFTRSSIEGELKQPKFRKRKPLIPFELTETPRLNSDQWEGRPAGRRKLMAAAGEAAEENQAKESRHTPESRKSRDQEEYQQSRPAGEASKGSRAEEPREGGNKRPKNQQRKNGAPGQKPHQENRPLQENKAQQGSGHLKESQESPAAKNHEESQGEAKKGKGFWAKRREEAKRRKKQEALGGQSLPKPDAAAESAALPGSTEKKEDHRRPAGSREEGSRPENPNNDGHKREKGKKLPAGQNQSRRPKEQAQEQRANSRPVKAREGSMGESQSLIKPYWLKK